MHSVCLNDKMTVLCCAVLQAQKHQAAVRDVAQDRLANAKVQAQDYAQSVQQQAADHMDRVRYLPADIAHEVPQEMLLAERQ